MPNQYTGPVPKPLNVAARKNKHLLSTQLTGTYYGDCGPIAKDLKQGLKVYLVPHDDNVHDPFAVGVYISMHGCAKEYEYNGKLVSRLGWIPAKAETDREVKLLLWKALTAGVKVDAKLVSVEHRGDGFIRNASIEIRLAEEA